MRSGIRKRAEGGSKQGPGGLRDSGAEKVTVARGHVVLWSRGASALRSAASGVLCACALPGAGRGGRSGLILAVGLATLGCGGVAEICTLGGSLFFSGGEVSATALFWELARSRHNAPRLCFPQT